MEVPVLLVSFVSQVTLITIVPLDIIFGVDSPVVAQPRIHKSQNQIRDGWNHVQPIIFVIMINVMNAQTVIPLLEHQHQHRAQCARHRVADPEMLKWRYAMKERTKAVVLVQLVVPAF